MNGLQWLLPILALPFLQSCSRSLPPSPPSAFELRLIVDCSSQDRSPKVYQLSSYGPICVSNDVVVNGSNVSRAALGFDSDQKASVEISLDEAGAARMNQITSSNVGSRFAVLVDHKLIGAPVIRSSLSNTMQISLGLERDAAEALAEKIESSGPQK